MLEPLVNVGGIVVIIKCKWKRKLCKCPHMINTGGTLLFAVNAIFQHGRSEVRLIRFCQMFCAVVLSSLPFQYSSGWLCFFVRSSNRIISRAEFLKWFLVWIDQRRMANRVYSVLMNIKNESVALIRRFRRLSSIGSGQFSWNSWNHWDCNWEWCFGQV